MKLKILYPLIPLLFFTACSASLSDKERVNEVYDDATEKLEKEADAIVSQYSQKVIEQVDPDPYFNPNEPVPHYYAEKLEDIGVSVPADKIYVNEDYEHYKEAQKITAPSDGPMQANTIKNAE